MVSMSTTPKPLDTAAAVAGGGGGGDEGGGGGGKKQVRGAAAAAAVMAPPPMAVPVPPAAGEEVRKVRKPYTITKSRESWTEPEHDKFLEALQLIHIHRRHLKMKEQGSVMPMDTATVRNTNANVAVPSWDNTLAQPFSAGHVQGAVATNNCSSSIESPSGTWPSSEAVEQENVVPPLRAMPDFARVYSFLGSIFDPDTSGHLQRLKAMDPIDVETVLLLMRNLSTNLRSPDFEQHRRLLSSYSYGGGDHVKSEGMENHGSAQSGHLPFLVTSE
ncbi:hypothetical protein BDA96_10G289100 [Sorghum bicolor]|uniref:Protein REVEILLE 6 n=2 Tax=Sorghum bicolor TaxID=4558 RepID=A0A921U2F7_SORBI|nr:hypothetical protein BDA96_10G289100 [Sorghum bicolor]KXG20581.1 hypothetical protein SORBI_3010G223700 [Sorghum bicolor]